jgi:hypothetical protein
MNFTMPSSFPENEFGAFGIAAGRFFPALLSDEALYDPLERRTHFDWSWQAVRYRYRSCAECSEEFKGLLGNVSQALVSGMSDEELTYKLERCIYVVSLPYASDIRAGRRRPHPRHWLSLAQLVSVSGPESP